MDGSRASLPPLLQDENALRGVLIRAFYIRCGRTAIPGNMFFQLDFSRKYSKLCVSMAMLRDANAMVNLNNDEHFSHLDASKMISQRKRLHSVQRCMRLRWTQNTVIRCMGSVFNDAAAAADASFIERTQVNHANCLWLKRLASHSSCHAAMQMQFVCLACTWHTRRHYSANENEKRNARIDGSIETSNEWVLSFKLFESL